MKYLFYEVGATARPSLASLRAVTMTTKQARLVGLLTGCESLVLVGWWDSPDGGISTT
jgi:hypothetical protein